MQLPPWIGGEKANDRIRMQNTWGWKPLREDPEKAAITTSKQCRLRHWITHGVITSLGAIFSCALEWNAAEILASANFPPAGEEH